MAGETQETTSSDPQPPETWSPPQNEAALAHLERLQNQLDALRSTMPSLISPLVQPTPDKTQKFALVRKTAKQTQEDLKAFREVWGSEEIKEVLERAKRSLEADGDLTKAQEVAKWGWGGKRAS